MEDIIVPTVLFCTLFVGMPWLILHYVTKWKSAQTLPIEDERLLDDLYEHARRLEDRLHTIERIITVDNPEWRPSLRQEDEENRQISYRNERSN